jgi:hypothetical protein
MDNDAWRRIAAAQAGLISRRQLNLLGIDRFTVRNQIRAERWVPLSEVVISTTTGPLSRDQRLWLGVLHAGPSAVLGDLTAAEVAGLKHWHRDDVCVLVPHDLDLERQPQRRDSAGRLRFTDCEWDLGDGRVLVLEVDGAFHMEVEHWEDDIARHRGLVDPRRIVVRCTAREVRDEQERLGADLRRLGVPGRAA